MKQSIFTNEGQQLEFDTEGIIKVPLFTADETEQLKSVFMELHPQWSDTMSSAYYFSVFGGDIAYRREIYNRFLPLVTQALQKVFSNFKVLAIIAQVKGTGENSQVNTHQDLSMVDEQKYSSCTVWIPLSDSTVENGAINALNKSQLAFRHFRAHTLETNFGQVKDFIVQNSKCYTAQKGEALVFDPATIHYSPPNKTQTPRLSLAVSIVSEKAPVQIGFFDKNAGNTDIDLYDVPDNFWYLYNDFIKERQERPSFGTFNSTLKNIAVTEFKLEAFVRSYNKLSPSPGNAAILKDAKLQQQLNEEGFVKIPFADADAVKKMLTLYARLSEGRNDIPKDILYTYLHNPDKDLVSSMNKGLEEVLMPLMQNVFTDFQHTSFTFQVKGLGEKSQLYAHQDWSFTDETKYRTYTFWLTLMDSYPENGTVYVLRRSHNKLNNVRGAGIEAVFADVQPQATAAMEPMYVKAGELLIFDSALGHYSPPNYTNKERVSVMTNLAHRDANFMLYFGKEKDSKVEISSYKVPGNFLMLYENFKQDYNRPPASAVHVNTVQSPVMKFSPESFKTFLKDIGKEEKWYVKLKKLVLS